MHVDRCQSQDDCEIFIRWQDVQQRNDMFLQEIRTGGTNDEVLVSERTKLIASDV
jgi:hypothetical protein